jgi:hypothetical protein
VPTVASGKGEEVVIISTGSKIVKLSALEVLPAGLATVTLAAPAAAMSVAGMGAVRRVLLTNVVVRFAPFHLTVAPDRKFVPSTVRVNAGPPALTEFGLSPVKVGVASLMTRVKALLALAGVAWLSRTWTVKLEAPEAVGVPLSTAVDAASVSPGGSDPAVTAQL